MNADCYADYFKRFDHWWLRCFGNGTVVKIKKPLPDKCPVCGRPLKAVYCKTPTMFREVLLTVDLPHYKRLARMKYIATADSATHSMK